MRPKARRAELPFYRKLLPPSRYLAESALLFVGLARPVKWPFGEGETKGIGGLHGLLCWYPP